MKAVQVDIEKLKPRDALKAFKFLINVRRDPEGHLIGGDTVTINGFNPKHAIERLRALTDDAHFVVVA